jgi:hypothetical protein
MTASTAAEFRSSSIGKASLRALIASWLGWMFDGYETYALVLVMASAVHQLLPPEHLPRASVYIGGLLAATMLGWAMGGVGAGILADYLGRRHTLMLSILETVVACRLCGSGTSYGQQQIDGNETSRQFHDHRNVEFRTVLLHVRRPVLLAELFDHRFHCLGFGDWLCPEFRFRSSSINSNGRVLEHVLVPLGVGALHGQEVQLFGFQHEPDRNRDRAPRLPADHAPV